MKKYFDRFMRWYARFMTGRTGPDALGGFLVYTALFIMIIELITKVSILSLIVDVLLLVEMFRYFSKNYAKRSAENAKFLELIKPVKHRIRFIGMALKDRENRYYLCPSCSQIVRIPKGHGKVLVTCPKCHHEFTKKS